nr:MAG TPA: BNR/Asp-box repeat protein [Caudoviricetes sp.]
MGSDLMRTVYVQACIRFPLGKQGENEAVRVVWPGIVEKFRKLYGSGAFTLTAKRCGDAAAYPVAVSTEGGDVVWLVRAADVASPGSGSCELTYTVDGAVAKSQTWSTYVAASISGDAPGEPPEEPARAWFATIQAQIGNLDDLTTKAKENLVAAINEAAKTGSGGAGSISMRTADGYIQYSTDGGETWENLIAVAELKGAPGKNGHTPKIAATKTGKTTSITADGLEIAQIKDGEDAAADLSLGITGAQVGQIAKITAVDASGVPTAWEPVEMTGDEVWEKIAEIVIPEGADEATTLTISKDSDGNPFSLAKARLCAKFPKYTGATVIPNFSFAMLNGKTTGRVAPLAYTSAWPKVSASYITGMVYEIDVSGAQQIEHVIKSGTSGWTADSTHDYVVYGTAYDNDGIWFGDTLWAKPITSIGGVNMLIYPGCRFVLYGVRA